MIDIIDSHCHLYYEPFISNIQTAIDECKKNNVNKLLTIGVDVKTSIKNIELANNHNEIFCTIGIHPNSTNDIDKSEIKKLENLIQQSKKIIGIGEIGLDYFRVHDKNKQRFFFEHQIDIAHKYKLPIVIHSREAESDTLSVIKKYKENNLNFLIHCFSGTENFALKCLELNCYISFSGIVTFKNAKSLREICKFVPDNKILFETDSPYLSPEPYRGRLNHPKNVKLIAEEIAKIRNCSLEHLCKLTNKNFKDLFGV